MSVITEQDASVEICTEKPPAAMDPQMWMYVRDLKRTLARERQKAEELNAALAESTSLQDLLRKSLAAEYERRLEVEQAHRDTVTRLMRASRFKDHETGAHILRVSRYSYVLAIEAGLGPVAAKLIASAAPMHDLGKVGIPDAILLKPGSLNAEERRSMEQHTSIGAEILGNACSPLIETSRQIAQTHHERWDGSGYPNGLRAGQIPIAGRIVMIADQYDALRSARPYKAGWSHREACRIMLEGDGRTMPDHFDPQLLLLFRKMASEFELVFEHSEECGDGEADGLEQWSERSIR